MSFVEVKPEELKDNPFDLVGKQWMLVSAGNADACNTMTASWGGFGILWGMPVATAYIRQTRYTKEFVDENDSFTLAVFDEKYRDALMLCGTVSGRDRDKMKEADLTPIFVDDSVGFEEARMIIVCKKLYAQYMGPENFVCKEIIDKYYGDQDFHTMYVGQITKVLVKED